MRGTLVTGGRGPCYTRLGGGPLSWSGLLTTGRGRLCAHSLWNPPAGGEQSCAGLVLLEGGGSALIAFGIPLPDASNPLGSVLIAFGTGGEASRLPCNSFTICSCESRCSAAQLPPSYPPYPSYPLMRAFGPTRGLCVGTVVTASRVMSLAQMPFVHS